MCSGGHALRLHNCYKLFLASMGCAVLVCLNPIWNCSEQDNSHLKIVCGCIAEGFWEITGKQILLNLAETFTERLYSLLAKLRCQYDKTYSQILGFQLYFEEKPLCLNGQNILLPPPLLLQLFVVSEKAMLRKKRAHGECIIPGDLKSFAWGKCDFTKACFEKGWLFCAIFSFYLPPPSSTSFQPSSSSPLHLCPSLYYSEERSTHR